MPGSLTGDRHVGKYAPDGRLFVSFRDTTHESPTRGDWVGWVGTYEDIVAGREGQYRVRLMDNTKAIDCAYPGVEVLPDGTFVATTYGHWAEGRAAVHRQRAVHAGGTRRPGEGRTEGGGQGDTGPGPRSRSRHRGGHRRTPPGTGRCEAGDDDPHRTRHLPGRALGPRAAGRAGPADRPAGRPTPSGLPSSRAATFGLHLSDPAHVELHDLVVERATGNGINIDDGGSPDTPAHHVVLRGLVVRDIGPAGNRDGIKLSGVDDFRVEGCTVERWGDRGSGIDMVGCHRGEVTGCTFRHGDRQGDNGVQAKGGSSEIAIRRCRFEHAGQRGVNLGGSTGPGLLPARAAGLRGEGHHGRGLHVRRLDDAGGLRGRGRGGGAAQHDLPAEAVGPAHPPGEQRGRASSPAATAGFTDNLIAFRSDEMAVPVNVGPGTAPETFTLARNAWYCLDAPERSRPRLPIAEADGVYGVDPRFRDAEGGDLRTRPDGPAGRAGVRAEGVVSGEGKP